MRVGIVGAGMAGLAAARELRRAGHDAVIFEKSHALGGRVATRRVGAYTFDTGATTLTPRGLEIESVILNELDATDLVRIPKPIFIHEFGRIMPGSGSKNAIPRYTYRNGINQLAKLLAEGLDIRRETRVGAIERCGDGGFAMMGETFEAVVLTCPIPQTQELLTTMGEPRAFPNVRYRCCLSVLLGYAADIGDRPYCALIEPEQRHPLTWLSIESLKSPDRAPEGHTALVAQLSPGFSAAHYEADDAWVIGEAVQFVARFFGDPFLTPAEAQVKRWKFSQPEMSTSFESANRGNGRLVIAGDGVAGPRIEDAFATGVRAARSLMATP